MENPEILRVASAEYPIDLLGSWEAYAQKIADYYVSAMHAEAQLLVFPEYGALELASLLSDWLWSQLDGQILALQDYREPLVRLHQSLCDQSGLHVLTPSFPCRMGHSFEFRNRAWFLSPNGRAQWQDKIMLTRFEREKWRIHGGNTLNAMSSPWGKIGVLLGYDSQFPMLARHLTQQGAEVLLVPSCTDSPAGYYRMRLSCRARALENQCFVVHSTTIGEAAWSPALAESYGQAGVFCPLDDGFPDDGQLGTQADESTNLLIADLNLGRAATLRMQSQVLNHLDWNGQFRVAK